MTTETEYIDLPTLQDVAKAQADGWEVMRLRECHDDADGWYPWIGKDWADHYQYRGRPRQPKMKESKMECWLCGTHLSWRTENASILRDWIRQPHLDLIAKVPE